MKNLKTKAIITLLLLCMLFSVLLTGCTGNESIKRIQFSDNESGTTKTNVDLKDSEITGFDARALETENSLKLYKVKRAEFAHDGEEVNAIAKYLKVDYADMTYNEEKNEISYDGSRNITFTITNGYRVVYNKFIDEYKMTHNITATNEELIEKGLKVLSEIPFLEGEYVYASMGERTFSDGVNEYVFYKSCTFRRKINGLAVDGNGSCTVGFTNDGLAMLTVSYYTYEEMNGKYDIISLEEAGEQLAKPQLFKTSQGNVSVENIAKLEISKCELVYVNEYNNGYDTIQPFYRIKGTLYSEHIENLDRIYTDSFTMYIPALE